MSWLCVSVPERGDFACVLSLFDSFRWRQFYPPVLSFLRFVPGFAEVDYHHQISISKEFSDGDYPQLKTGLKLDVQE
jgi:hypothetical protein